MAREQAAPLVARVKELEEELTRVAGEWDTSRSQAGEATTLSKVLAGQLGAEQSAHQLTKGTLDEALMVAEASQTEAVIWRGNAEGESCSLYLIRFSCVRPLTPWCDTELAGEASRAAEATRVEAQRLKEKAEASQAEGQRWKEKAEASRVEARRWEQKAKGESRRLPSLFGLFSFALNPIPFVLAQSWRRRSPEQPRPLSQCRRCLRPRSGSTTR